MSRTADEVYAIGRAAGKRRNRQLMTVAAFVLIMFLTLAGLLQIQQRHLAELIADNAASTQRMCEQRRTNAIKTNANWEALAAIERRNKFIDDDIRQARLRVYENAKLTVPVCT